MKDIKKIKCSKCGFSNVLGTKKCVKCKTKLEIPTKSCPKCAKINKKDVNKCVSCGYKFNGRKRGMLANLIISLVIVGILIFLVVLEHNGVVSSITKGLKVLSLLFVVYIVYSSLSYGSKEIANYESAEKDLIKENKKFSKMKKISNIAVVIGALIVFAILIYFYFFK